MAAKKKRRGLSGSPEHHKDAAKKLYRSAIDALVRSSVLAQKGNCSEAHDTLLVGAIRAGKADANIGEVTEHRQPLRDTAADAFQSANQNYSKFCIRDVGLSGMKRRSRRR